MIKITSAEGIVYIVEYPGTVVTESIQHKRFAEGYQLLFDLKVDSGEIPSRSDYEYLLAKMIVEIEGGTMDETNRTVWIPNVPLES